MKGGLALYLDVFELWPDNYSMHDPLASKIANKQGFPSSYLGNYLLPRTRSKQFAWFVSCVHAGDSILNIPDQPSGNLMDTTYGRIQKESKCIPNTVLHLLVFIISY